MPKKHVSIDKAIESLETEVRRIRQEMPNLEIGPPMVFGDSAVLEEFASFMLDRGAGVKRTKLIQFSMDSGERDVVILCLTKGLPILIGAFIAFLRSKKCSIELNGKDFSLKASAPTESQLEKILKMSDHIFLHKNKRKKRR